MTDVVIASRSIAKQSSVFVGVGWIASIVKCRSQWRKIFEPRVILAL